MHIFFLSPIHARAPSVRDVWLLLAILLTMAAAWPLIRFLAKRGYLTQNSQTPDEQP